ncbi:bck1-like resistance to osmotic shock [Mollisiaceae sp. DMI_Dod_QoI]|nr:bck1-like resistance to osmotic shock [Helotiales sp. DMI_Dod_QoI]
MQAPMISTPLKATNEIDWIQPLKQYIRQTYGDDPERYAEECATLNRLRQDMRGAGKDSAAGRDLLYRYYGQLELLDLRFPVDENHIKISFTWFDAFTHKPTSQYSLAYEKASIIFNISAVLSCHAAHQTRSEDSGLKTAYHSFQASAGMFTYINENFLHAPSTDLSRDTVKTLIQIMLAQGQEVFLEKQIADGKKVGLLAKLASQAGYLYAQAVEGTQENVNKAVFEKVWLLVVQIKASYMYSLAQYYQAMADDDANSHGIAVSRLQVAETAAKEANKIANSFPGNVPANSNLNSETGSTLAEITKRHLAIVQEKLSELIKDNDYIYHQTVPAEAALSVIPKLPAAKAIPVSELYAGQDIQRITGPDIFQKIVPMSVTESASLYDEEKAKLVRAETERVETANSEMAASLDYLRLPGALQVLKGGFDQELTADDEFRGWCDEVANHDIPNSTFDFLRTSKEAIVAVLDKSTRQLDMEESVCEKMRSKYEGDWTQQPSSRLTTTLRSDIRNYRDALEEAARSDNTLNSKMRQYENDFEEMRSAGEIGEADVLFQRALIQAGGKSKNNVGSPVGGGNLIDDDFGDGTPSVMDQVAKVEDILKKLNLLKRERAQVLKDLKEKVHTDDISQVLILNKKSISNYENQLFQAELEKFRPHQQRLLSANHKQSSLMKELTSTFNALLQDKRVRSEQSKYESITRQRSSVMSKYKRVYQEFLDLEAGLQAAKDWYREMKDTVDSLDKNVETFVNNRRSEGASLLTQIEQDRTASASGQADRERERIRGLMERMSMNPSTSPSSDRPPRTQSVSYTSPSPTARYPTTNFAGQYQVPTSPPSQTQQPQSTHPAFSSQNGSFLPPQSQSRTDQYVLSQAGPQRSGPQVQEGYNPGMYPPVSPPPNQTSFPQNIQNYGRPVAQSPAQQPYIPPGYVPPPPPRGPPPLGPQQTFQQPGAPPVGHGDYTYGNQQRGAPQQSANSSDPWAGLNSWR